MVNNSESKEKDVILGSLNPPCKSTQNKFCFGIVGFADILGFGEKVKDDKQRDDLIKAYREIHSRIRDKGDWTYAYLTGTLQGFGEEVGRDFFTIVPAAEHLYMISDSIFFVLVPESSVKFESGPADLDVAYFGVTAVRLMAKILTVCWKYGLPARGAISDGMVYYDSSEQIFVGEPIVKAVRWEPTQDFAWYTIDPTSYISREVEKRPSFLISKVTRKLEKCENLFNKRLEDFRKEWPFGSLSPLTSWPDSLTTVMQEQQRDSDFFSEVSSELLSLLESNIQASGETYKYFWQNTMELFRSIGFFPA